MPHCSLRRAVRGDLVTVLVVIVSGSSAPPVACADESGTVDDPTNPAPPVDPEARRLYERALAHFKNGEFDEAIVKLEAAHRIAPAAELLYNLGQAYRRKGDCKQALDYYRRFLDTDPAGLAGERARARVAEMEACAGPATDSAHHEAKPVIGEISPRVRPGAIGQAPPTPVGLSKPLVVAHPNLDGQPGEPLVNAPGWWRRHRLPLLVSAGAVLLASASGYLAWRAHQASDRMSAVFERGDTWTPAEAHNESSGQWQERAAMGTGVLGLASGALAAWLYWR